MNRYLLVNVCRTLLLCVVLLHTTGRTYAQNKKARVLFIGDSYTSTNDLPKMVADMAASTGDTMTYDMSAPDGFSFYDHVDPYATSNTPAIKKLRAGGWDYVVLQEKSWFAALPAGTYSELYYTYSFAFAKQLVDSVRRYNPCVRIIFFMTWGGQHGLPDACSMYSNWPYNWSGHCTYRTMDSLIRLRTIDQAHFNKAAVGPAGAVWRYIRSAYPGIDLYKPDGSNPSLAGSYAGACSIYTAIFKKPAEGITFIASLPAAAAANIRTAADKVVYDSLQYWRVGKYETKAGFSHTTHRLHTISFTNQSVKASQYKWDFGDGQYSTATDPTHTYASPGNYTVRLIATGISCSDTVYARIHVADDPDAGKFVVAPNPATDQLYIRSGLFMANQYHIQLLNSLGQAVYDQPSAGAVVQTIPVPGLPGGVYMLQIYHSNKRVHSKKILIQ